MSKRNYLSRSSKKKGKVDRILNWAIGIVSALILIVGGFLLFTVTNVTGDKTQQTATEEKTGNPSEDGSESKNATSANNDDSNSNTSTNDSTMTSADNSSNDDSSNETTKDSEKDQENGNSEGNPTSDEPKLQGPWEPVGTTQEGTHNKNYNQGSTDWNEMEKAIAYATGLSESQWTLWWLGNGGTPDTSVGVVSPASNTDLVYVVELKWIDNKGWKPINVQKMSHDDAVNQGYIE